MTTVNETESYEEFIARSFYEAYKKSIARLGPSLPEWEDSPYVRKSMIDKAKELVSDGIITHA